MLQYSTVEPGTLELLRKLMSVTELSNFNLVGGTALALYFGHRISVDLDLFASVDFDVLEITSVLEKAFPDFTYSKPNVVGIFGFINDVKVDLVKHHHHPNIANTVTIDGLRLLSKEDIMAIKVAAIFKRAVKKDFWDLAELLEHFTMEDMINSYHNKYPSSQMLISIPQALTYFAEAEESEDPVSLKGQTWTGIKKKIQKAVNDYLK
jgi:predicted nucleotidyltransferase component of viral defense system